jgi:hypothetical protein
VDRFIRQDLPVAEITLGYLWESRRRFTTRRCDGTPTVPPGK